MVICRGNPGYIMTFYLSLSFITYIKLFIAFVYMKHYETNFHKQVSCKRQTKVLDFCECFRKSSSIDLSTQLSKQSFLCFYQSFLSIDLEDCYCMVISKNLSVKKMDERPRKSDISMSESHQRKI